MKRRILWTNKIYFFLKRYGLAELVSAGLSYLLAWVSMLLKDDRLLASYSGSFGAFIGFYVVIYLNQFRKFPKEKAFSQFQIHRRIVADLLIEFGLSEVMDLFLIRPACLYFAQVLIADFTIAILVGSQVANIFFFLLSAFMFSRIEFISGKWLSVKKKPDQLLSHNEGKP